MSAQGDQQVSERLAQALAAFQRAQGLILTAHRQLRGVDQVTSKRFWAGTGAKLDQHLRTCATALVAAYQAFSAGGGVAAAGDRRLVNEAHQLLHEADERRAMPPKSDVIERRDDWRASERLRDLIHQELERRGITDLAEIGAALELPAKDTHGLLTRRQWREGDVAALQAVAERLGVHVP